MFKKPTSALIGALAALLVAAPAFSQPGRSVPVFETWTVDCTNTGACFSSSFTREQSTWVDLRIVRDWQADAQPLVRLTTNTALPPDGNIGFSVDGQVIETLPLVQLREFQSTVTPPAGFSPLGGEGFWYPTGPASTALIEALQNGQELRVTLPAENGETAVGVPLYGLKSSLLWLDNRQNRTGTTAAIVSPGDDPAADAPHAMPILSPDQLPPEVSAIWAANRLCSTIDPAIFASMNAVSAPLDDGAFLYIIPCGTPTAYNSPYVTILTGKDGAARQVHVARMSDKGPVASDLVYNARWYAADRQLVSYFKGSGVGECGLWNRWLWNGTGLVLMEEAARKTCDGTEADLSKWSNTWPVKITSD